MGRVIFSIKYDIVPEKKDEYLRIIKELKNLVKAEGLESYSAYRQKSKDNSYEEIYIFESEEAYENFDDYSDERVDILMTQLSELIKQQSTHYSTLFEISR